MTLFNKPAYAMERIKNVSPEKHSKSLAAMEPVMYLY